MRGTHENTPGMTVLSGFILLSLAVAHIAKKVANGQIMELVLTWALIGAIVVTMAIAVQVYRGGDIA